jgi:cobyrinic acid a,c-diamide synthase
LIANSPRGFIIAAPHSGAGKTTITLAILAALKRRGLSVRAAKAGPDYIDPAFHLAVTGHASVNLDSWAMSGDLLDALAARTANDADVFVIEGVMGLFDGAAASATPRGGRGSTADLAAHFDLPVLLVLDVSRQAQSAAALVRGFATHDPAVRVAGVVLNRVASARHRAMVADAVKAVGIPVFGALPRDSGLELPERHLGLVLAGEHPDMAERIGRLADAAESHFDLDAILASAAAFQIVSRRQAAALPPPGQRIALANDRAFGFIYPHLLDAWRSAGAAILPFSPLAGEPPPDSADCCWLAGGYPELHAEALAAAHQFSSGLRRFAQTRPVHGECGGYMVLGESLEDASGRRHAMTGLLGHSTSFAQRKLHLGYRTVRLLSDTSLGAAGKHIRGHEFHYASLTSPGGDEPFAEIVGSESDAVPTGGRRGRVTGAFFHAIAGADA